jgi:hypothetical protein
MRRVFRAFEAEDIAFSSVLEGIGFILDPVMLV